MLKSQSSVSVKVTLFGKRVFANVAELRGGHTGLGGLDPATVVLMRRENMGTGGAKTDMGR